MIAPLAYKSKLAAASRVSGAHQLWERLAAAIRLSGDPLSVGASAIAGRSSASPSRSIINIEDFRCDHPADSVPYRTALASVATLAVLAQPTLQCRQFVVRPVVVLIAQPMAQTPPNQIPDITETELWVMRATLKERYPRDIELKLVDADECISPADRELTACPVIVSQSDDGCTFAMFKVGGRRDRCQFFYKPYKQMGAGRSELRRSGRMRCRAAPDPDRRRRRGAW